MELVVVSGSCGTKPLSYRYSLCWCCERPGGPSHCQSLLLALACGVNAEADKLALRRARLTFAATAVVWPHTSSKVSDVYSCALKPEAPGGTTPIHPLANSVPRCCVGQFHTFSTSRHTHVIASRHSCQPLRSQVRRDQAFHAQQALTSLCCPIHFCAIHSFIQSFVQDAGN